MYPRPSRAELTAWEQYQRSTDAAAAGFDTYNTVKKLIVPRSQAGAGIVPGTPQNMHMQLTELAGVSDWGSVAAEVAGAAAELGNKLASIFDDSKDKAEEFRQRTALWNDVKNMCANDRLAYYN